MITGRLYNNGAYTKTSESTEHNSYNPSLFPVEVSLLVQYLVFASPVRSGFLA
jgi:hypothetical protein